MKTFLHILKRILTEKYPDADFESYLSSRSKNGAELQYLVIV